LQRDSGSRRSDFHDYGNQPRYFHNDGNIWYTVIGKGVFPLNYKEAIVEIVGKIQNERILKRIYKFVAYLYTHEADS